MLATGSRDPPEEPQWEGRRNFFAAAAEAMRRILINRARDRVGETGTYRLTVQRYEVEKEKKK